MTSGGAQSGNFIAHLYATSIRKPRQAGEVSGFSPRRARRGRTKPVYVFAIFFFWLFKVHQVHQVHQVHPASQSSPKVHLLILRYYCASKLSQLGEHKKGILYSPRKTHDLFCWSSLKFMSCDRKEPTSLPSPPTFPVFMRPPGH